MSAAAISAIRQCYSIIGMDTSALRFKWARAKAESLRSLYRRRRAMLTAAGMHLIEQYAEWDELPESVRDAMNAALLD